MTHSVKDLAEDEMARVREVYEGRKRRFEKDFYALYQPANLFMRQSFERALVALLREHGFFPLSHRRILDIGTGEGNWLATFEYYGAQRKNLAGIELDEERAEYCRERIKGADVRAGNALDLPWKNGAFDLVSQFTVFSSLLDAGAKQSLAKEMLRVMKPNGAIVWGDFLYDNPNNPDVRGVKLKEIRQLFPDTKISYKKVCLAPPLARRLVPLSWSIATVLEWLNVLNTHYIALIRRQ